MPITIGDLADRMEVVGNVAFSDDAIDSLANLLIDCAERDEVESSDGSAEP